MKSTHFKKIIKEAVKEAIQEELKDILLEAVKAPKSQPINENISNNPIPSTPSFENPTTNVRQNYSDIMSETAISMNSKDVPRFNPQGSDPINGNLGGGELSMDAITNLLNSK
tara:strand:+ start:4425 stop:4763 length:339 start_codon:yes stop_codon:yes gene_type:complete